MSLPQPCLRQFVQLVDLLLVISGAAAVPAVAPAQFVDPEQGESCGEPQQNDGVCRTHGGLHAAAVLLVGYPVLDFFLGFLDLFLVHAIMTPGDSYPAQKLLLLDHFVQKWLDLQPAMW